MNDPRYATLMLRTYPTTYANGRNEIRVLAREAALNTARGLIPYPTSWYGATATDRVFRVEYEREFDRLMGAEVEG